MYVFFSDAAASWGTPFITADTSDQYIKDANLGNGQLTIYEDVPINYKIAGLNITAQPGQIITSRYILSSDIYGHFFLVIVTVCLGRTDFNGIYTSLYE